LPPDLFQAACLRRAGTAPLAVLPPGFTGGPALVPLGEVRPVSSRGLKRWLTPPEPRP
jgi:hypothetical protein